MGGSFAARFASAAAALKCTRFGGRDARPGARRSEAFRGGAERGREPARAAAWPRAPRRAIRPLHALWLRLSLVVLGPLCAGAHTIPVAEGFAASPSCAANDLDVSLHMNNGRYGP